ncbi:hypothetical protein SLS55_006784 [Diplodia seriata]|uniref:Uncharacterized protein n=1 Tax=Diplodia seriata TaxID=420778 RepID=A0ABR3CFI1_9PEZI
MESQGKSPDVIIGIDFGMTCTDWHLPKTIQNWPGKCLANKVATTISYCDGKQDPVSWGFQAESGYGEGTDTQRDFKLFLDPAYQNGCHGAPTPTEAEQYFRDYLHCIYKFIQQYFKRSQPHWATKTVEYVFSVPTTWKHPSIVAGIQRAIQAAGFGSANEHTARVTLTEAEAAAVYVAKENYQTDDVFMVCDAGGGTTDVNILKVMASGLGVTRLQPLSHVEGLPVGSTIIDYKMAAMIEDRLRLSGYHFQTDVGVIADEMVRDKFEMFKCSFGSDASNLPFIPLPVPELPPRSNHPQAGIQGSAIMLPRCVRENASPMQHTDADAERT